MFDTFSRTTDFAYRKVDGLRKLERAEFDDPRARHRFSRLACQVQAGCQLLVSMTF
jgi:hypothetical protein